MNPPIQAVILAGGRGSRLGAYTDNLPKPMMNIAGRPFIDYLITNLARRGIDEIILSLGYLHETITDYIGDGSRYGLTVHFCIEQMELGTGGGLLNCFHLLQDSFFLLNGDTLFDVNFARLASLYTASTLALRHVSDSSRFGSVAVGKTGHVVSFKEKGVQGPGLINGGVLWLKKCDLKYLPEGRSSIEADLLPKLAQNRLLYAVDMNGFFIDIGLPQTLADAQTLLPAWERKPIAFLDRDGVLNYDCGYVHRITDFRWLPGAREAITLLNDAGYHVVVVTNQSGIARGYYGEDDFHCLTQWMQDDLWKHCAHIDLVLYCPFHEDGVIPKFTVSSFDRKPNPGMLMKAFSVLPHSFSGSFLIGDQQTDIQAAHAAGIDAYLFSQGRLDEFVLSVLR